MSGPKGGKMQEVRIFRAGKEEFIVGAYGERVSITARAAAGSVGSVSVFLSNPNPCHTFPWRCSSGMPGTNYTVSLNNSHLWLDSVVDGDCHVIASVYLPDLWPVLEREFPAALNEAIAIASQYGEDAS